ncbi:MAG: hypothetical protein ACR2PY_01140 [Salinispira sp.]
MSLLKDFLTAVKPDADPELKKIVVLLLVLAAFVFVGCNNPETVGTDTKNITCVSQTTPDYSGGSIEIELCFDENTLEYTKYSCTSSIIDCYIDERGRACTQSKVDASIKSCVGYTKS